MEQETQQNTDAAAAVEELSEEEFSDYIEMVRQGTPPEEAAQDPPAEEGPQEPPEEAHEAPFRSFQTEEELRAFEEAAAGSRLQELRARYDPYIEQLGAISELAKGYYGAKTSQAAIEQLLSDLQAQSAERDGKSVEEYMRIKELERDAAAYRQQQAAQQKGRQETERILSEWQRQEQVLKKLAPGFSLRRALENSAFYKRVVEDGYSLSEAYMAQEAAQGTHPKSPARRVIQEAGAQKTARQGVIRQDAKDMTDQEFAEYIRRIQNG